MKIEEHEGAVAVWTGVKGATNWLASLGGSLKKLAAALGSGLKALNPSKFLGGVADYVGGALKKGFFE